MQRTSCVCTYTCNLQRRQPRRCERSGQYDVALRLLDEMRKKRMRFYDIGILDELFKRLLAGLSLLRGRRAAAAAAARSPLPPSKRGDGDD